MSFIRTTFRHENRGCQTSRGVPAAGMRRLGEAGYPVVFDDDFPGMRRFHSEDPHGNRLEFLEPIP